MSQLSSPVLNPDGNLHKRRMTVSPEKFNKGYFEPVVRTDIPLPAYEPPAKRTRTAGLEKKIEIYYDSVGTPRIKETPASVEAGFTPTTAVFSASTTQATPLPPFPEAPQSAETVEKQVPVVTASNVMELLKTLPPEKRAQWMETYGKKIKKKFSMLDAFVRDDTLCMLLVSYLPAASVIDLYAISKYFHYKFNKEATAFIMASVRTWAPGAEFIFPWRCFRRLCIKDPVKRQKASAVKERGGPDAEADYEQLAEGSRDVPSLRWLQMVIFRNHVCKDMIISLAARSLRNDPAIMDTVQVNFQFAVSSRLY